MNFSLLTPPPPPLPSSSHNILGGYIYWENGVKRKKGKQKEYGTEKIMRNIEKEEEKMPIGNGVYGGGGVGWE